MRTLPIRYIVSILLCLTLSATPRAQLSSHDAQHALDHAVRGTPAVALVLDVKTGRILAAVRIDERRQAAPGSVLKPFFLMQALLHQQIYPQTTAICRRNLHINGRNLDCTHPQSETVFNAEQALAYSCNSYFAELAKRFTGEEATTALSSYGLLENSAVRLPLNTQETQLFILGLEGVYITPLRLAEAYRRLAMQLQNLPPDSPMQAVERGLEDSIVYGMAHNAYVDGLPTAGKTGTASDPGQAWTHGWFAGFAPAKSPKAVVVVYLPKGNSADAAHLAQIFLSEYKGALLP